MKVQREPIEINKHGKRRAVVISPEDSGDLSVYSSASSSVALSEFE